MYKLFCGRYWQAGVRQRESAQTASTSLCWLRVLPEATRLYRTRRLPFTAKLPDQQTGLFHRKTGGVFQSPLCTMLGGCLSYCCCCTGPRNTDSPGLQSQAIKHCPLGSSGKKLGHQMCKKATCRDILVL